MSEVRDPKVTAVKRHGGRRPKGLKAVPKAVFVVVAVCVALLILVPLKKKPSGTPRPVTPTPASSGAAVPVTAIPAPSSSYTPGLELSEYAADRPSRKIKGVVKNTTDKVFGDVRVTFQTFDDKGLRGAVYSVVGTLEPHASSRFETQPMTVNWRGYSLPELVGTPR